MYKHIETLDQGVKEFQKKISDLEVEIVELKRELGSVNMETRSKRKVLDISKTDLNTTNAFVKELNKNFTQANTLADKHSMDIQHLYNSTDIINETLVIVKERLDETIAFTQRLDKTVGCQSGYGIGEYSFPHILYQFERTVKFNPPFSTVPAFSYAITLLDTKTHLSIDVQLISLTADSASLNFINLSGKQNRGFCGVRISWIACPK